MAKQSTEVSLFDQGLAELQAAKDKATKLADEAILIKVADETSLAIAQQKLSVLSDLEKAIEKDRKVRKQPHLDAGKLVDDTAKALTGCLAPGTSYLRAEILRWEKERREAEAERQRIAQEAENAKKEKEAELKIVSYIGNVQAWLKGLVESADTLDKIDQAISNIGTQLEPAGKMGKHAGEYQIAIDIHLKILNTKKKELIGEIPAGTAELQSQIASTQSNLANVQKELQAEINMLEEAKENVEVIDTAAVSNTRTSWSFELKDITKVLPEWLTIDEKKVKEWLKEHKDTLKDGDIVNGIQFKQELVLVVR